MMNHPNPEVRRGAASVLGNMGREAQAAIPVLQAALCDETVWVFAAQALWQMDPEGRLTFPAFVPRARSPLATLTAALRHKDAEQRRDAASALGQLRPPPWSALPALVEALHDKEFNVRQAATYALRELGVRVGVDGPTLRQVFQVDRAKSPAERDRERIRLLSAALSHAPSLNRQGLFAMLGELGPDAVPVLIKALEYREAAASAARALGHIRPPSRAAVTALVRAIQTRKPGEGTLLRLEAIEAIGRIGSAAKEAVPALIEALRDDEEDEAGELRKAAVQSLGGMGPAAVPALVHGLEEKDGYVRAGVAEALGLLGPSGKEAVPALRKALTDANSAVRVQAALAVWRITGQTETTVPVLRQAMKLKTLKEKSEYGVHRSAKDALLAMGAAAHEEVPALIAQLRDPKVRGTVRGMHVVEILAGIGPAAAEAAPVLAESLKPGSKFYRPNSAWALGKMGAAAKVAIPALITALRDKEGPLRWASAAALGRMGPEARQAVPALTRALGDSDPPVRASAAYALGQIGAAARPALPALAKALQDPQPIVRWASLTALQALGSAAREAIPVLRELVLDRRSSIGMELAHHSFGWNMPYEEHYYKMWQLSENRLDVAPVLVAYLHDGSATVPERAIRVLLAIDPDAKEIVPALLAACKDKRVTVRRAAADALRKIAPETADTALLPAAERDALWADLGAESVEKAYHAAWTFVLAPRKAVPWMRDHLKPAVPPDAAQLARWIKELDHSEFAVREKAMRQLRELAELAVPALKKELQGKPSLEVRRRVEQLLKDIDGGAPSAAYLRALRGVGVLERIGTPGARQVLVSLTKGAPEARLTREAHAALSRLDAKPLSP